MVVCGSVVSLGMNLSGLGMNLMRSRGSPWVRWSWLAVGAVVVAHHGWSWLAVGRLDLMGWLGWIRWWLG